MYDWKETYPSIEKLNLGFRPNLNVVLCGWYIDNDEFYLVSRNTKVGKELYVGKPQEGETVNFYAFSGKISESPFGQTIPVQSDLRGS